MFNRKKKKLETQHQAIMRAIKDATSRSKCVILVNTSLGTRVIIIGKSPVHRQVEEILERKGF